MKNQIKKLSLTLIIIVVLSASFGCSQDNKPETQVRVYTNVGFIDDLISEDGKDYAEIGVNGGSLKVKIEDKDILSSINTGEFYKFAYDENNLLLSIEQDRYIEDMVQRSMEQGIIPSDESYISASDKISTEGLALIDSYTIDINGNGIEETIAMYVNAEQGSNGEIYWDDGQDWLFLVEGKDQDYILFNDYVQLGDIKFHIYTEDDDFYITIIQSGTANLDVTEYKFVQESEEFVSTLKHRATGNVNMLHSSYRY